MRHLVSAGPILALATVALFAVAPTQESAKPGIKTDRGVYDRLPVEALPPAGGVITNRVFGPEILRVTDERDGAENQNAYSCCPSLNLDSTRLFINSAGKPMLYDLDPGAFELLDKRLLFARTAPGGSQPRWESAIRSGTDPNMLLCHGGLRVWQFDVETREYILVKDLTGERRSPYRHWSRL